MDKKTIGKLVVGAIVGALAALGINVGAEPAPVPKLAERIAAVEVEVRGCREDIKELKDALNRVYGYGK